MNNNKFDLLSAPERQFYILYLMLDLIQSNYEINKNKLWSLTSAYCKELYKVEALHKEYSPFQISEEEQTIFKIRGALNRKVKGHILTGKKYNEIYEIIHSIISINFIRNQYDREEITNQQINSIKELQFIVESNLFKLEDSTAKIDILKFDWIITKFKNSNQNVIILLISTLIISIFYIISANLNHEGINMGVFFQILIGTPTAVLLIMNLIKNDKNQ
jgi:hypothetical protein